MENATAAQLDASFARFANYTESKPDERATLYQEVDSLTPSQTFVFRYILYLFWAYWDNEEDTRHESGGFYNFPLYTWINCLYRIAASIKNAPTSISDCWFTSATPARDSYPAIKVLPLIYETRGQQGTRWFAKRGTKGYSITIHRLFTMLKVENVGLIIGNRRLQSSHRCGHTECVNFFHLKVCTDTENKDDRSCTNGCSNYCPHEPECLFTNSLTGKVRPCRSDPSVARSTSDCRCENHCFY